MRHKFDSNLEPSTLGQIRVEAPISWPISPNMWLILVKKWYNL